MAALVSLYGVLLQQKSVPVYTPPSEAMTLRPVANPLGAAAAWGWLARLLNQRPQRITATILLAFLKPTAHTLVEAYPRQLPKLLRFIHTVYVPQVQARPPEPGPRSLAPGARPSIRARASARRAPPPPCRRAALRRRRRP